MPFKSPDGKEFATKKEYREYMMLTFYSFKDKVNEPEPLIKQPGSIDGQQFDIGDCENSTLCVLDYTEQVQIDECKKCRIFIGACTSSLFIRNCTDCVFYTCCRQLRLRDVTNCTFYIYSMSEVHIELSNALKFAPFNGGYPGQADHMKQANLDPTHNLWYDIFDHNDPGKTHENWALLDKSLYEEPWFPLGQSEPPAIPLVEIGSVKKQVEGGGMQEFNADQLRADAAKLGISSAPTPPSASSEGPPAPPVEASAPAPTAPAKDQDPALMSLISGYVIMNPAIFAKDAMLLQSNGQSLPLPLTSAPMRTLANIEVIHMAPSKEMAWCTFWVATILAAPSKTKVTAIFEKEGEEWKIAHVVESSPVAP